MTVQHGAGRAKLIYRVSIIFAKIVKKMELQVKF